MAPVSYLVKKMASTLYTITHFLLVSMKHCHLNILMFLLAANLCPFTLAFPQILYSTFQSFLLLQFFLLFLTYAFLLFPFCFLISFFSALSWISISHATLQHQSFHQLIFQDHSFLHLHC